MDSFAPFPHENQDFDFRRIVRLIVTHWWLIGSCLALALGAAILYNRYAQPVYSAAGSIIVKDESSNSLGQDAAQLQQFDIFKGKKNLSTEIEIIKSQSVVERTVNAMDSTFIHVSYFAKGRLKTTDLYKDSPFVVAVDSLYPHAYEKPFFLQFDGKGGYDLSFGEEDPTPAQTYRAGDTVHNAFGRFRVLLNPTRGLTPDPATTYYFVAHHPSTPVAVFRGRVGAFRASEETSILFITCQDEVPERAMDFVNTLINEYTKRGIDEKSNVARNTIKFIDRQLEQTRDSVAYWEGVIENFKKTRGIVNLTPDFTLEKFTTYDNRRLELQLQLNALDSLERQIRQGKDTGVVSTSNFGTQDSRFSASLAQLNELETERKALLAYATPDNPKVLASNKKVELLRSKLYEDLSSYREALRNNVRTIGKAIGGFESALQKVPETEREYIGIQRKYNLASNTYQFLLQERSRASIAEAATVSDVLALDYAGLPGEPITPKKSLAYIIGIFVALTVSISFIFTRDLLDDTIADANQVEKLIRVPLLGTISHARDTKGHSLVVADKPKSAVAESFRSIRTNIQFLATGTNHKVVVVTSTVGGEGKTFFSINVSAILALLGKKVLLIGLDLRKPQLHRELGIPADVGITKVLIGKATPEEVIFKTAVEGLDVMPAGAIPPNPSELITSDAMRNLLQELKPNYDYIFLDTPPIGLVTDALVAMAYSDINIYLLRQKKSKRAFLNTINKLYQDQTTKNIAVVLNDVKARSYGNSYGYGYGYGYGYYEEESARLPRLRGWLKRLIPFAN
jgi:capsular exopolysaccharide synthesis family protein